MNMTKHRTYDLYSFTIVAHRFPSKTFIYEKHDLLLILLFDVEIGQSLGR